jgi:hypothetical protein
LVSSETGYAGNVTYLWTVNGLNAGSGKSLSVNASLLVASTAAQLASGDSISNTIALRVTPSPALDSSVYGEAVLIVAVAPSYTLALRVKKRGDDSATSVTALVDQLQLSVSTNFGPAAPPYSLTSSFVFSFVSESVSALSAAPTSDPNVFIALAPMPYSTIGGSTSVTLGVQLLLGGLVVAHAAAAFNIAAPDTATAAASLILQATAITDSTVALAAVANIQTLMQATSNATTKKLLAVTAVTMLANSVADLSAQSAQQQATVLSTLTIALSSTTDLSLLAAMREKALTLVTSAVSSASFDPDNGAAALAALAAISVQSSHTVVATLAL